MKSILNSLIIFSLLIVHCLHCEKNSFKNIIKNGILYDGLGNNPAKSEIGIKDGLIKEVDVNLSTIGVTIIQIENMVVVP